MSHRTCMELGLCQQRNPACHNCDWKFSHRSVQPVMRRRKARLVRYVNAGAGIVVLIALAVFAVGYVGARAGVL